ncbi:hypothetical protein HK405_001615, partial [Cladochytrium tenue]
MAEPPPTPAFARLPRELLLFIVAHPAGSLYPEDLRELARASRALRAVLIELKDVIFEELIVRRFDSDLVAAYRTGHSPFHPASCEFASSRCSPASLPWGPSVLATCLPPLQPPIADPSLGRYPSASRPDRPSPSSAAAGHLGAVARRVSPSRQPRAEPAGPASRAFHDLATLSGWLAGMDDIVAHTMRGFLASARPVAAAATGDGVFVLGRGWEAAAATVLHRRRRLQE